MTKAGDYAAIGAPVLRKADDGDSVGKLAIERIICRRIVDEYDLGKRITLGVECPNDVVNDFRVVESVNMP
jgi:hypothetical protein